LDFCSGLTIYNANSKVKKKTLLWISISLNLGFLVFFKYYNFFILSFVDFFQFLGFHPNIWLINLVLPVGISFYTFHGISYVLDIYYGRLIPTKNWVTYSLFVSYFPLLVAGPIERANHLLKQLESKRYFIFDNAIAGFNLIAVGFFKKVVIADTLAPIVNDIFQKPDSFGGGTLILGAVYFSFQIYGDFSGYSDIARGISKLLGIELIKNFNYPYFSRSISEFWRKWHISLSSWFRDYVYIPLGGSRVKKELVVRNILIIFILSGFWHGANWTFIFWGLIHALFYIFAFLFGLNRDYLNDEFENNNWYPSILELVNIIFTFCIVTFGWIFFRSSSLKNAFIYIQSINNLHVDKYLSYLIFCFLCILLDLYLKFNKKLPYLIEFLLFLLVLNFWNNKTEDFIYFQF
jgi:D-alanyl-lipoteichoic acid acyltransferase DltB (MBOAT superfamily)